MNKRNSLRRMLALLCCMAMLLPCVPAAVAAENVFLSVDFESYADDAALLENWVKGGNTEVNQPRLSTDRAFSGKQSLLLVDDETDKSLFTRCKQPGGVPVPAGTEVILSMQYYAESADGPATPYLNLYANKNHQVFAYSTGKWDSLSVIYTTESDNQALYPIIGSNTPPTTKIYVDDVKMQVLTEELAVAYVNEKAMIPEAGRGAELMVGLTSKALGLTGVDSNSASAYFEALQAARKEKGSDLTKTEIQNCVANVSMETVAKDLEGGILSVGVKGSIPANLTALPSGVTAQWVSVSPANKAISLSGGKATVTAIPTGADDIYKAVLRLATASKSVDVNYTIRLVNEDGLNAEEVNAAKAGLIEKTVIGVTAAGTVPAPQVSVAGVTAKWDRIKYDPKGSAELTDGKLTVKAVPTGLEYYEAIAVLKLTKGAASTEVEYNIISYDKTYQTLMDVPNAGMEVVDKDGHPVGWTDVVVASAVSWAEGSDKEARTGDRSVRIVDTDPEVNTSGIRLKGGSLPANPGHEYVGTFWAKGVTTAEVANRAGVATYVEYWNGGSRPGAAQGPAITANSDDWTLVSMWSMVESTHVGIMAYSFVNTVSDVYVDDFMIWELNAAGSALATDALLTGNGDADTLYQRLKIKTLGTSGLNEAYKADYLSTLTAKRAAKGSPLTAAELAAGVNTVNNEVAGANKAALNKLVNQVVTRQTVTQTGTIALPELGDSTVTAKFTSVSGAGASHVQLSGLSARVVSLPTYGSKDTTAALTLTLTKGGASVDVNITLVLKAYTKNMNDMAYAAQTLKVDDYLGGQKANFVTKDITDLPTALPGGISIKWQALDSATLQTSKFVTGQGKVTRPAYGEPDAAVALRATLSKGSDKYSHDLYILVPAEGVEDARTVITRNPDFEAAAIKGKIPTPDGWLNTVMWADGKSELATSYSNTNTKVVYTGTQSMCIAAEGVKYTGQDSAQASVRNSAVTTVKEGHVYTLEVMTYTESDVTNPGIKLTFLDNEGLEIAAGTTLAYADAPGGRGVWKNLTITAAAPAGAIFASVDLQGGTVAGDTYFDDVRLREWPIVANGGFDLGTAGWTTAGKVADGKLTLTSGQTAVSMVRAADRGVTYYLSLEAEGGKAALRFVDKDGKALAEYAKNMSAGLNALFAYAPANTAGVQVVLTGTMTADKVKITRSVTGTGITDGDFENSANAGVGTPWDLTNAVIGANTGKTGAGLTVNAGGKALSNFFSVEDGKGYIFTADVKGKDAQMVINLYNFQKKQMNRVTVESAGDEWNTVTYRIDQLFEAVDGAAPEHSYGQIVLTGGTFDNVKLTATAKSVSEPSMENTKFIPYGTFPHNWSSYGKAAAYVANQPDQYPEGVKGLAVDLFGIGEGGIRSSMIRDVKSGKAYEATVMAKGSGAKLIIEFWDQDFNKLGSEFVTIDSEDWKEYSVIGTAPGGTIYATLAVGGDGVGSVVADQAAVFPVVRSIGNNVQLFLDNWLIADSQNVKRTLYRGEEVEGARTQVYSYPSIQWDEKEQVFKMWSQSSYKMRYCTSKDGINWTNWVPGYNKETGAEMYGGYVHIDEDEPDPNKRYKAIIFNHVQSRVEGSYDYWTSADGIYWTFVTQAIRGQDVETMIYDEVNDEYIVTYKISMTSPASTQNKRSHSTIKSKDLINWTEAVRQYSVGTPEDTIEQNMIRTDGYGNGMYALGDSYVSLNWRFLQNDADSFGGQLDSNLLFSRNLEEDWQRLEDENGKAFLAIPRGAEGEPDDAQIYTAGGATQMGDETWWYYYGLSGDHGYAEYPRTGYGSAVKWRRNGFGSMDFSANGTLTTEQFTLMGTELHLNAVGSLTVELLDASGAVAAIGKFSGDSVDGAVTWDKSIASQAGKVVSLRFTGADAKLYTIQVCGSIFSDVSADAWYYRAAHYAADNGIMAGTGNGTFSPNSTLTRAMIIQMLYNKVGQPKISDKHGFSDVPADQWFNNAVTWGTKNGVMAGYGGGKFGPNDNVTIEQIAVILWNYSGNPEFDAELTDVGKYDGWAKNALTWAVDNGVLHGVNFKNATDNATRAQAAQMLTNYLRW